MNTEKTELSLTDLSNNLIEISKKYGSDLPYQRDRVIQEALVYRQQSLDCVIAFGYRLIQIKENEPHGEFVKIVEAQFDLDRRAAHRIMQACLKLSNVATSRHLIEAAKSKSKLFELMILDDDELQELSEGGTVAGINLDEVSKMSVKELRAALRKSEETISKERERIESLERISADKSKKIDDLDAKLQKKEKADRKIELERDPNTEIIETYKSGWLDISKQLQASMYDVKTILAKSQQEDALPHHFYQQIAIELNDVRNQINELMILLPSDITPDLDDSFLDDISND